MKEARSAIIAVLILLLIIAGVGVAISRVAQREEAQGTEKPVEEQGWLERVLLSFRNKDEADTPGSAVNEDATDAESTSEDSPTMIITSESSTESDTGNGAPTAQSEDVYRISSDDSTVQKGITTTQSIPATGAPAGVVLMSLAGLAAGIFLKQSSTK